MREYIKTARPIGSESLVERYRLDMSPATVRNELAVLTELGYLRQPHTSAGRVPTEDGYRYFVGQLLEETELPDPVRRTIYHQFYQTRYDTDEWMRLAASILARQSKGASLITAPHTEEARFKHIELISTVGRQTLMVLVLLGGEVHQRLFTLSEPVTQEQLSSAATRLNQVLHAMSVDEICAAFGKLQGLEEQAARWAVENMRRAQEAASGELVLDGLKNVLAEPEFSDSGDARPVLKLLEERSMLLDLLSRAVLSPSAGGVQVLIGGEGTWDELRQCSVVLARYGMPGIITGTLGVLGPMRMPYGRTISTVRFLSNLLSDLVADTMLE